ncbi:MAG: LD-carboxypeptidase [Sphingobacteriales bacterium]|nr:MAG: LD-carboxypeptidase [Sphingobacteriales bacterium]
MQQPKFLQAGSTIGITCPSGYIPFEQVRYAADVLEQKGYKVKLDNTGVHDLYLSGSDGERLQGLQQMLDDEDVDVILMGRGGYGLSRIIDQLNFDAFIKKPKWICGFSDVVVLLNHVQAQFDIPVLHSPMCNAYKPETLDSDHLKSFFAAISGDELSYSIPSNSHNRVGNAEGILTGGNLAILAHLTGSASEVDTTGKILFIEDVGEYLYNIDRMMLNLKRAGKLDSIAGLILGGFTDMKDTTRPFGETIEQIILEKVGEYDYPVCFNFPAGHQDINYTLCLGLHHQLKVTATGATLKLLR